MPTTLLRFVHERLKLGTAWRCQMSRSEGMTNVLWLQGASCGGCTMSILESGASGWFDELRQFGVNLLWHPSVSEELSLIHI